MHAHFKHMIRNFSREYYGRSKRQDRTKLIFEKSILFKHLVY